MKLNFTKYKNHQRILLKIYKRLPSYVPVRTNGIVPLHYLSKKKRSQLIKYVQEVSG